jgi:hypothetical protein
MGTHAGRVDRQQHGGFGLPESACSRTAANIAAYVPSSDQRRCLSHTDCHAPNCTADHATASPSDTATQFPPTSDDDRSKADRAGRPRHGKIGSITFHNSSEITPERSTPRSSRTQRNVISRHALIQCNAVRTAWQSGVVDRKTTSGAIRSCAGYGRTRNCSSWSHCHAPAGRWPPDGGPCWSSELASWAGLTPKHHQSDTTVHRGRITKQGSVLVRWAAIEAAQSAGKYSRTGQRRDRIGQRRGRNIGVTAAARDLIRLVYYALRDGQVNDKDRSVQRAAAPVLPQRH